MQEGKSSLFILRICSTFSIIYFPLKHHCRYSQSIASSDFSWSRWLKIFHTKIDNQIPISSECATELLELIDTHTIDNEHALQILESCLVAYRLDGGECSVMDEVWKRLTKANVQFQYTHYDCMLSYYSIHGNGAAAQDIYDHLVDVGFHADWLVVRFCIRI